MSVRYIRIAFERLLPAEPLMQAFIPQLDRALLAVFPDADKPDLSYDPDPGLPPRPASLRYSVTVEAEDVEAAEKAVHAVIDREWAGFDYLR